MGIEWVIVNLLGIEPKSTFGKGVLFFINLPGNIFIYLITIVSTIIVLPIIWLFTSIFGKSKGN